MIQLTIRLSLMFVLLLSPMVTRAAGILDLFDHDEHRAKAFKEHKMDCSHCHFFTVVPGTNKIQIDPGVGTSIFKVSVKEMCHECHRSPETKYMNAPKECSSCHRSMESLSRIMPLNHKNVSWKETHAMAARVQGDSCLTCHAPSSCTKCHLERNDVQMRNHGPNYRFFHSVQARMQPQKCDSCHATSFCIKCHQGKAYH